MRGEKASDTQPAKHCAELLSGLHLPPPPPLLPSFLPSVLSPLPFSLSLLFSIVIFFFLPSPSSPFLLFFSSSSYPLPLISGACGLAQAFKIWALSFPLFLFLFRLLLFLRPSPSSLLSKHSPSLVATARSNSRDDALLLDSWESCRSTQSHTGPARVRTRCSSRTAPGSPPPAARLHSTDCRQRPSRSSDSCWLSGTAPSSRSSAHPRGAFPTPLRSAAEQRQRQRRRQRPWHRCAEAEPQVAQSQSVC